MRRPIPVPPVWLWHAYGVGGCLAALNGEVVIGVIVVGIASACSELTRLVR